jgi:ATP-dependent Clp protease ATP-binding subunit ClpA
MASPADSADDVFHRDGSLRLELMSEAAVEALRESLRQARETGWDNVRSPHVFMGLLAAPDASVRYWGGRLEADLHLEGNLTTLLGQFQELFCQQEGAGEAVLALHREFLSDNVIRLLRQAHQRAAYHRRSRLTPMDLLISMLTAPNNIVAECFERSSGVTAAKLTELAVIAEQQARRP